MIPFNKPYLPPRKEFDSYIDGIWDNHWLTNQGPLVSLLEKRMAAYLNVRHVSFVSSGTMALQLVLQSLPQKGGIITTPYSYVATTSALVWEGHKPVFADILPGQMNLNPENVAKLITKETVAILATHTYGNECKIAEFEQLANKFDIPLIYDGAHCFGSTHQNKSLLAFGDYSILSTHATKLFHTANGGFVISKTAAAKNKIDRLKNFGHNGQNNFDGIGINGKNSELHAALGLCLLTTAEELVGRRRDQWDVYNEAMKGSKYESLKLENPEGFNGSYFPIICPNAENCTALLAKSEAENIELRKYFSPSLNQLDYVDEASVPNSEAMANKVLCLPLFHELTAEEQSAVIQLILD